MSGTHHHLRYPADDLRFTDGQRCGSPVISTTFRLGMVMSGHFLGASVGHLHPVMGVLMVAGFT
jgi:hypothetical protein